MVGLAATLVLATGKMQRASLVEHEILEVKGSHGVLRLRVRKNEIAFKKCVGGEKE